MRMKALSLCLAIGLAACTAKLPPASGEKGAPDAATDASWPRFLGPNGNNLSEASGLPLEWQEKKGKGLKWKIALPGQGWSTPVVGGGRIYCTTALENGKSLHALCLSLTDGSTIWDAEVLKVEEPPPKHDRNSYASPTPLLEGDRLYVTFGAMGTACVSTEDGSKIWENRELKWDQQNGAGGSVSGYKDLLLIPCDGADVQFEAALSKKDGKIVWKSERSADPILKQRSADMRKAYGTPVVLEVGGEPTSFTMGAQRLYALNPLTGEERWFINYAPGFSNVPTPVTDGKKLYISTGFQKPELWAIKLEPAKGDATETHVVWKQKKGAPLESTPVVYKDRLFMVNSTGIATCLKTEDGSIVWQERIGPDFAATPLVADGRVYFFDTWGKAYVVEASDTFKLIATNKLEAGCMASPVPVGKALLVRTKTHLYRIEN
jgi:outer membrane protein assembly factor BamB